MSYSTSPRDLARHAAVGALFLAGAIAWSWPLSAQLGTHLPGRGIGDNAMFLWNFWWMRESWAAGVSFFESRYLFAPVGVDLTLNTHTALPAFVGATFLKNFPLVTSLDLVVLAGLALNGFCAYLLAWRLVRDRGAAIFAGAVFGGSPYLAAHLNGHFNLTMAWTIPLFALTALEWSAASHRWALAAGAVLAATAFVDYYYLVYELAFALLILALNAFDWNVEVRGNRGHRAEALERLFMFALAVDLVAMAAIVATGGFRIHVGSITVVMDRLFNPLQLLWALVLVLFWLRLRPHIRVRARDISLAALRSVGIGIAVFVLGALPIVWHGASLILRGGYVTQSGGWRSAPAGVDLATVFLGNPFHGLWGPWIRSVYSQLGIDVIESGGWPGIAPFLLSAYAIWRSWADPRVRTWTIVGVVFSMWALGAHVHTFGWNTGFIMPGAALRFVPIVSNARMPGRSMVLVYLAMGVLGALALSEIRKRASHPGTVLSVALVAVLIDFCPAPFATVALDCPPVFAVIDRQPERGAVAVLPMGLRDGFGELAPLDHRVIACQPVFRRPLVGGAVARLSPAILEAYRADPLIAEWLRLSGARPGVVPRGVQPDRALAKERLAADGIDFVALDRGRASAALTAFVEQVLPLRKIEESDGYALFRVAH